MKRTKNPIAIGLIIVLLFSFRIDVHAVSRSEVRNQLVSVLYGGKGGCVSCDFDGYSSSSTSGRHEGIDISFRNGASVYAACEGVITNVRFGKEGRGNPLSAYLSTVAVYYEPLNKTVVYLHLAPNSSLHVGQSIAKGQNIGTQSWRGCTTAAGGHTHVEVRDGRQVSAATSVNDPNLENANPYPFWENVLYRNPHNPHGMLEAASGGYGTFYIGGWVKDDDTPNEAVELHVYIGGEASPSRAAHTEIYANNYREDVGPYWFDATVPVYDYEYGNQTIYVYAINRGEGENILLGTWDITILHKPRGALDVLYGNEGKVHITGWAFDDDTPDQPVTVHAYVGGKAGSGVPGSGDIIANVPREQNVGNHGFDAEFSTNFRGTQDLYLYFIDTSGSGEFTELGPFTVDIPDGGASPQVPGRPRGALDMIYVNEGSVHITGWAFDDDTPDQPVTVHAYIGGKAGSGVPGSGDIIANIQREEAVGKHGFDAEIPTDFYGNQEVYLYFIDTSGSGEFTELGPWTVNIPKKEPPTIEQVRVSNITTSGYTVSATVKDNYAVGKVQMPTWYQNNASGDPDAAWYDASGNGQTYSCTISRISGKNNYYTDLYAWDTIGQRTQYAGTVFVQNKTVTFDPNGGTISQQSKTVINARVQPSSGNAAYYSKYGSLPVPTKNGYVFSGWYTERNGGTKISENTPVTIMSNQTLYAHWELGYYDVSLFGRLGNMVTLKKYHGIDLELPNDSLEDGDDGDVVFVGWNVREDGQGEAFNPGEIYSEDEPITLYSQWREMTCLELPADLKKIEDQAFMGIKAEVIKINSGCEEIGAEAFKNCTELKKVYLPASVTIIAENAFSGNNDFIICAPESSYAVQWAENNGIPYIVQ